MCMFVFFMIKCFSFTIYTCLNNLTDSLVSVQTIYFHFLFFAGDFHLCNSCTIVWMWYDNMLRYAIIFPCIMNNIKTDQRQHALVPNFTANHCIMSQKRANFLKKVTEKKSSLAEAIGSWFKAHWLNFMVLYDRRSKKKMSIKKKEFIIESFSSPWYQPFVVFKCFLMRHSTETSKKTVLKRQIGCSCKLSLLFFFSSTTWKNIVK